MTGKRSILAKLRDLTTIVLVVGLVVGVSTWVVDARQRHTAAPRSMPTEHSASRLAVSWNAL
jgi:hypothetical protein